MEKQTSQKSQKQPGAKEQRADFEPLELELTDGLTAGADEAGRGAYAGPLAVGFVVFRRETLLSVPDDLKEVNDSKQLSGKVRERLAVTVKRHAAFSCVVYLSNRRIDREGINVCTEKALLYALARCRAGGLAPGLLLMDGKFRFSALARQIEYKTLIEGDARALSIAAASILAKEGRDRRMRRYSRLFPEWEFDVHKGYGTAAHRSLLESREPGPLHRRSFSIVPEPMLDFGEEFRASGQPRNRHSS